MIISWSLYFLLSVVSEVLGCALWIPSLGSSVFVGPLRDPDWEFLDPSEEH